MRTRDWSLRAKILSLSLIPLGTLVAMWALATAVTVGPGLDLLHAQSSLNLVGQPSQALTTQLQAERKITLASLASGGKDATALLGQRARTDAAIAALHATADTDKAHSASTAQTLQQLTAVYAALDGLTQLRGEVDRGSTDRPTAMARYTDLIDANFRLDSSLVRVSDGTLARQSFALIDLLQARELLAQEDSLVNAALTAGPLTPGDVTRATQLIGARLFLYGQTLPSLADEDRAQYQQIVTSPAYTQLAAYEAEIMTAGRTTVGAAVTAASWSSTYGAVNEQLSHLELDTADRLVKRSTPLAVTIFGRIAIAGLLGLITVVVSIIMTIRIARRLIRRLAGLRQAAQELAVDRLPRVVSRLRQGEPVDIANEAPALPYGEDEIGLVGRAFNDLQRTAVNSAIDEANVRRGLNEVFLNIARRSQTLLHRQLSILDRMERRADDPTELEDLFRIDHLATRMRRHAEDLVILAGAAPGRGWRNPVPAVDVLRGAVSEVEDYARVSIRPMPEIAIVGRAVGDVIHLLAELIENATSFSPPHTRVNVGGELVAHGFAIEIEDRGLGMAADSLAEGNSRLTDPPEFDPSNSAQLGLFVVARLAARNGIRVQLRPSPYGGITAVVLIPDDLVMAAPDANAPPRPRGAVAALTAGPGSPAGPPDGRSDSGHRELAAAPHLTTLRPVGPSTPAAAPKPPKVPSAIPAPRQAKVAGRSTVVPRHSRREIIDAGEVDGADGLPKRIRQTNLAPQLRDDPASPGVSPSGDIATPQASSRSPEELRAMMSSFQSGMNRGRQDADAADFDDRGEGAPGRDAQ